MEERNKWDIEQAKIDDARQERRIEDHEQRIRVLETFRDSTIEKLITVFNTLEDIREGKKYGRRLVTTSLVTSIIGGIIAAVFHYLKG